MVCRVHALLVGLTLGVVHLCGAHAQSVTAERVLLEGIAGSISNWDEFSAANGFYWNRSQPLCLWKGVACSSTGRVTSVDIACRSCAVPAMGSLTPMLVELPLLETFNVQGNQFNSTLPPEWGANNVFMTLENLYLQNNNLSGSVPSTWLSPGSFPALQVLRIDANQLTGTIPDEFNQTSFPQLSILRLFGNQMTGTLPTSLGELANLQILSLQDNRFTGSLPPWWRFSKLRELYLQNNRLTGSLPGSWGRNATVVNVNIMELGINQFEGGLPGDWGVNNSFPFLNRLSLANASLSGLLPEEWGTGTGLQSLAELSIQRNNFTGNVPASWSSLPGLTQVTIRPGNPSLCAALPEGSTIEYCQEASYICSTTFNAKLVLSNNQHRDSISAANASCVAPESSDSGSSFPVAAVVAPVVSVVVIGALCMAFFLWRRHRKKQLAASALHSLMNKDKDDLEVGSRSPTILPLQGDDDGDRFQLGLESSPGAVGHSSDGATGFVDKSSDPCQSWVTPGSATPLGPSMNSGSDHVSDNPVRLDIAGISDWEVFPQEIEIVHRHDGSKWKLGSGGFGTVYKALRNGVQPVAVKMVTPTSGDMRLTALEDFKREISILKACRDVNIVQFVGASLTPENTMLVTEYCEGGNLSNNIAAGRVSWYRRGTRIALDVAKALVFLHSRRIVHFDLKSPNILLARDGTAKVSDVGMAKILQRDYITGAVGTLAWAAPEMLWGERCTEKADIYSYGIVLWEICTGERPVRGQLRDVVVPTECPQYVHDLILDCLETRPSRRPSALQIVERINAGVQHQHCGSGAPDTVAEPGHQATRDDPRSDLGGQTGRRDWTSMGPGPGSLPRSCRFVTEESSGNAANHDGAAVDTAASSSS